MIKKYHHKQTADDGLHGIAAYIYANQSERTSDSGFQTYDKYKVAYQISDQSLWILTNNSPAEWIQVNGGGGGSSGFYSSSGTETISGTNSYTILTADSDTAGIYMVHCVADCGLVGGGTMNLSIKNNGVEVFGGNVYPASESGPSPHYEYSMPIDLVATDVLSITITSADLSGGFTALWGIEAQHLDPHD